MPSLEDPRMSWDNGRRGALGEREAEVLDAVGTLSELVDESRGGTSKRCFERPRVMATPSSSAASLSGVKRGLRPCAVVSRWCGTPGRPR